MVHAEKIATALAGGVANTRWRDFGDLYILSQRHDVDGAELASALASVASRREIELRPLAVVLTGYAQLAQPRYHAWRRKNRRDEIPEQFAKVLIHVIAFADPALGASRAAHLVCVRRQRGVTERAGPAGLRGRGDPWVPCGLAVGQVAARKGLRGLERSRTCVPEGPLTCSLSGAGDRDQTGTISLEVRREGSGAIRRST